MVTRVAVLRKNLDGSYDYLLRVPVPAILRPKYARIGAKSLLPGATAEDNTAVESGAILEIENSTRFREAATPERRHTSRTPRLDAQGKQVVDEAGFPVFDTAEIVIPSRSPATGAEKRQSLENAWAHKVADLAAEATAAAGDTVSVASWDDTGTWRAR